MSARTKKKKKIALCCCKIILAESHFLVLFLSTECYEHLSTVFPSKFMNLEFPVLILHPKYPVCSNPFFIRFIVQLLIIDSPSNYSWCGGLKGIHRCLDSFQRWRLSPLSWTEGRTPMASNTQDMVMRMALDCQCVSSRQCV